MITPRPRQLVVALAIAMLAALLSACAPRAAVAPAPPASEPSAPAPSARAPRGTIVFDMAHGEIFSPEDTSELGQSQAVGQMQASGYEVRVNTAAIDATTLDGVAALYLPGPMRPLSAEEQGVLDDYLERGGTVILTVHVPFPVLSLPARWGLPVRTGVMLSTTTATGPDPGIIAAETIETDPLTEGVKSVVVVSGWPVMTDKTKLASGKLVVKTSDLIAADTNNSGAFDLEDVQSPFGVVGVAPVGSGRVVVLGDDAIFANLGIGQGDNSRLLDNILNLISAPKGA